MTGNHLGRRLLRLSPLAALAIVLVIMGGPQKLSQLPALARWGLFACMVFALIEPLLPGRRFGTQFVPSTETIALNKYARTFWRVFLIINICCFVAEMIGVAWFYGEVPLKYSLIAPAVILVLIGVIWKSLKMASDSSRLQVK